MPEYLGRRLLIAVNGKPIQHVAEISGGRFTVDIKLSYAGRIWFPEPKIFLFRKGMGGWIANLKVISLTHWRFSQIVYGSQYDIIAFHPDAHERHIVVCTTCSKVC